MTIIFDATNDKTRTPIIQSKIRLGKSEFRTNWGLYGTEDWLNNLRKDGLIISLNGEITNLLMTGHNDFPEFEMETDEGIFRFERLGAENKYQIGKIIKVEAIKGKYIMHISGFEDNLTPVRIEIE